MSHSLSLPITAQHSCWDWWQDMGLAGEVRGGGVYIQPSGGGGGRGKGWREHTRLNRQERGGYGNFSHKHSPISAWFHCFLIIII